MAKISRALQKIFGSSGASSQFGQFGSLAAGSPTTTKDPATIQALANYLTGWYGAVIGNNSPAIEDRNALDFLMTRQLAYLFQQGIAEWETNTEYHLGSLVMDASGNVYQSITNDNQGNAVTDLANWRPLNFTGARNYLVNPEMAFMQDLDGRTGNYNAIDDGDFAFDQWTLQTDGGAGEIQSMHQSSDLSNGNYSYYGVIRNNTAATTLKAGLMNMFSQKDTTRFIGREVVFRCALDGNIAHNMKIAIVAWSPGSYTVNGFDRAAVNSWGAGNPTLKADWSYIAVSDVIPISTGSILPTEYQISGTIPTTAKNVGVFVWTDGTLNGSTPDFFRISRCSWEFGKIATPYWLITKSLSEQLWECQNFYQKSWDNDLGPGVFTTARGSEYVTVLSNGASSLLDASINFKQPFPDQGKFPVADVTFYSQTGTADTWSLINPGGSNGTCTVHPLQTSQKGVHLDPTAPSVTLTSGNAYQINGHWIADARLGS
jgi:hypothetical protein